MILELYELLVADENLIPTRFGGLASYVRHLAHVLNLIVKEILLSLKAGDSASATQACDSVTEGKMLFPGNFSALSKIRVLCSPYMLPGVPNDDSNGKTFVLLMD